MNSRKSLEALEEKENISPRVPSSGPRKSYEAWKERNEVITLLEHRENIQIVQDIVHDIVFCATGSPKQAHVEPARDESCHSVGHKMAEQIHHSTRSEELVNGTAVLLAQTATVLEGIPEKVTGEIADQPTMEPTHVKVTPSKVPNLRHSAHMEQHGEKETADATQPYESLSAGSTADTNCLNPRVEVGVLVPVAGERLEGPCEVALDHAYSSSEKFTPEHSFKQSSTKGSPFTSGNLCTPHARLLECRAVMSPQVLMMQVSPLKQMLGVSDKGLGAPYPTNEILISSETRPIESVQENLVTQQPAGADRRADASLDSSFLEAPEAFKDLHSKHSLESATQHSTVEEMHIPSAHTITALCSPSSLQKGCLQGTVPEDDNVASEESYNSKLFDSTDVHPKPQTTSKGSSASISAQGTVFSLQDLRLPLQKEDLLAPTTGVITDKAATEAPGIGDVTIQSPDHIPEPYSEGGVKVMPNTVQGMAEYILKPAAAAQMLKECVSHEIVDGNRTLATDMEDKDLPNVGGQQDFLASTMSSRLLTKETDRSDTVQSQVTPVKDCPPQSPAMLEATLVDTQETSVIDNMFHLLVSASTVAGPQKDMTRSSTPNRASVPEMNVTDTSSKTLCSPTIPYLECVQEDVKEAGNASWAPVVCDASCFADEENSTDSSLSNITVLERSSFLASNNSSSNRSKSDSDAGPVGVTAAETSESSETIINKDTEKRLGTIEASGRQGIQEENEVHRSPEVPQGNAQSEESVQEGAGGDIPDITEYKNGDDSAVLSGADASSFLQAEVSELEPVGCFFSLSARYGQETDNVGRSRSEPASPAASAAVDKLADNIPENTGAIEVAASETSSEADVLFTTSYNEKDEDGTECARPRQDRTSASQSSSDVELEQEVRSPPSKEMDILESNVCENASSASVTNCDLDTSYKTATDTSPLTEEETIYFDAFNTTASALTHEGAQLPAAGVDGGCIDPVLPSTSEKFQFVIDFAGVTNGSSSRLSTSKEKAEGDEDTLALPSVLEGEGPSLALGGCAELPHPNDITMLCRKHLSEQGDGHICGPVRSSEFEQQETKWSPIAKEPPVKETWEPSFSISDELHFGQEEGLSSEKETVLQAPGNSKTEVTVFSEEEFQCAVDYFKDPSAFDFLQKVGSNKELQRSSLGRCSLYLKFDPLLNDRRKSLAVPVAVQEESSSKQEAVNSDITLTQDALIDFVSSPSQQLVDISVPSKSVPAKAEKQMFSETEMSQALKLQELMFQERLLKKEWELCEEQKQAKARFKMQENAICFMHQTIMEITRSCNDSSKEIMRLNADINELTTERNQLMEDLRGLETTFSDFHRRYERAKDLIRTMKENEAVLRRGLVESRDMLQQKDEMNNELKTLVEQSTEKAKHAVEDLRKHTDSEITVLQAQLKRVEMKNSSLEKQLEDKTKENAQLTQMYDDLLNKVRQD